MEGTTPYRAHVPQSQGNRYPHVTEGLPFTLVFYCRYEGGYVKRKDHFSRWKENGMNLRAKIYVEDQKKRAQAGLDTRRALLKEKGLKDPEIKKDVTARKLKADVRKADFRLASIAAQEKLNQDRVQAKADKLAAGKAAKEAPEKKEKKEKKGKKEKSEKQAKSEGKKEKPEKKKEQAEAQ
jgi:hypothetical protein